MISFINYNLDENFKLNDVKISIGEFLRDLDSVDEQDYVGKITIGMCKDIKILELEELMGETAASMITKHPQYDILAARIAIKSLHRRTKNSFVDKMNFLKKHDKISESFYNFCEENKKIIEENINYLMDYKFNYFGVKTIEKAYLMRVDNEIVERPQDMFMRVACFIHQDNIDDAMETYHLMSQKYFIHPSSTLFYAGTKNPQLSSCFLMDIKDDSIEGIFSTVKDVAIISKYSGGIGLNIHKIRGITQCGDNRSGYSGGIIPMLRVFNATMGFVFQGVGRRLGATCIYIEPWHPEMMNFLKLRKNIGNKK